MINKYIETLSKALWDSDLIPTRVTLFLAELFWAVMLLWAGTSFERPSYANMSDIANEEVWGVVFAASACVQIGIVVTGNIHSTLAKYFAMWNALLWIFVVTSIIAAVFPPPAAIGGELALMLGASWIWVRPYILAIGYKHAGIIV